MKDFIFYLPTTLYFGKDSHLKLKEAALRFNFKNVLVISGNHSAKSGLLDIICNQFKDTGIKYSTYVGVTANPEVKYVIDCLKIAKENNVDSIIAVGGGSVIDVSKSVAANFYYEGDPYDFNRGLAKVSRALPLGVVLTIAAAGSEMSNSCVISNSAINLKAGFNSDLVRPLFSIMNPELTFSLDKYQIACGVTDIISHSFERYFLPSEEIEFSDSLALTIMKDTMKFGEISVNDPTNYDARGALMLDSSYSHNGLTGLGKEGAFSVHKMEHVLSSVNPKIAHGAGLAVLMPAWMKCVYKYDIEKFTRFANELFNINYEDKNESAIIGIQCLKSFFKRIGMPTSLTELGFTKEDIPSLADLMSLNGTRVIGPQSIKPLSREDVVSILEIALY